MILVYSNTQKKMDNDVICPIKNWQKYGHLLASGCPFATTKGTKTSTSALVRTWREAATKAGIDHDTVAKIQGHSFRRTFAHQAKLDEMPTNLQNIQQGWKNKRNHQNNMLEHYADVPQPSGIRR